MLSAHVKELKDCALHNNFNQAAFVESLRVCKKASDTPKLQVTIIIRFYIKLIFVFLEHKTKIIYW